jgi:diaminopimelate decarboxylase
VADDWVADERAEAMRDALRRAAHRWGTPLYVTDVAAIEAAAADLLAAFPDPWIRQYSLKANDLPAIVARIGRLGFGANVVSRGEWALARRAGIPNARTTLEGIGKTDADLRTAVRAAVAGDALHWIAIESADEAAALAHLAARAGLGHDHAPEPVGPVGRADRTDARETAVDMHGHAHAHHEERRDRRHRVARIDVLLRLNPGVTPETHAGLAVGAAGSKFGLADDELAAAIEAGGGPGGPIRWRGIHLHVGSQLGAVDAWRDAVRRALALVALMHGTLPHFDTLDLGGGFPVSTDDAAPLPAPARFASELPALLATIPADRRPRRMAIEPGRYLTARAGWLVGRVLHVRPTRGPDGGPLVVIDAGMTELVRPALYGARHRVVALTSLGHAVDAAAAAPAGATPTAVEGPVCESTDSLGIHSLPPLRRGDLVAVRDAGAYGASLSSRYNGRPRPAEALVEPDGSLVLARRRSTIASLG